MGAELGVMISASHNPVADNGIKFFGSDGFKLSDEQENEIEALLDQENPELPRPVAMILYIIQITLKGHKYLSYLKSTVDVSFEGLKIALDGADNGSTSSLAPFLFGDLEASTETIGCSPTDIISMRNVALHILKF